MKWYEYVMPKDGVRAYVAILAFTAATAYAGWEVYQTGKTPDWYIGYASTILAFYFMTAKGKE